MIWRVDFSRFRNRISPGIWNESAPLYLVAVAHLKSVLRGLSLILHAPCPLTLCYRALQRKSHLCIPFLGIARPQSQFPHSCVCERFIYSQDRPTYILPAAERQINRGNIKIAHRHMNVEVGTVAAQFLSGNTCLEFSVLCLFRAKGESMTSLVQARFP